MEPQSNRSASPAPKGACSETDCRCSSFSPQLYRPAMCIGCFHTISTHFPGEWKEVVDDKTGKVFFEGIADPSKRLLARMTDADKVSILASKRSSNAMRSRGDTLTDMNDLPNEVDAWAAFLSDQTSAPSDNRRASSTTSPALPPRSVPKAAAAPPPLTSVQEQEDDDDEDDAAGPEALGAKLAAAATPKAVASALQAAADHVPDAPSAVPQAALNALAIDLDTLSRRLDASVGHQPLSFLPTSIGAATASVSDSDDVVLVAHGLQAVDLGHSQPASARSAGSDSAADALHPALLSAGSAGPSGAVAVGLSASQTESTPMPQLDQSTVDASHATVLMTSPAAAQPSTPAQPMSTVDLSIHLGPVYDDPLVVNLNTPAFSKERGGVLVFRVAQPYEENFTVPRYLLVTPFTVLAVAPHPSKLGIAQVKWERSILSLTSLVSQPLFTAIDAAAVLVQGASASAVDELFTGAGGAKRATGHATSVSMDDYILDRLPYGMAASSTSAAGAGSQDGAGRHGRSLTDGADAGAAVKLGKRSFGSAIAGGMRSLLGFSPKLEGEATPGKDGSRPRAGSKTSAAKVGGSPLLGAQATGIDVKYKLTGIGLLSSFAPESSNTMTLLRTYRAGKRPQKLSGWLWKRKRQAWREHAPLGPLAWKKRYFVLEPGHITYYSKPGGGAKGLVPLSGWVEVARVTADASPSWTLGDATTKPHCFVVRTGRTYHVFQASSDADSDAWVEAISINAQHSGCALDEPQCLILPSHADAEALAKAVSQRRADLVASLGANSVVGKDELFLDLSASQTIAEAAMSQQLAQAAATEYAQERQRAHMQAQAASQAAIVPITSMPSYGLGQAAYASTESMGSARSYTGLYSPPEPPHAQQQQQQQSYAGRSAASAGHAVDDNGEPQEGNVTIAEAEALVLAMGEATDEFLAQLPRSVQLEMRRRHRPDTVAAAEQAFAERDQRRQQRAAATAAPVPLPQSQLVPPGPSERFLPSYWVYLDDNRQPQGPFPEDAMRAWLLQRYFVPTTMVHAASPLLSDESSEVAANLKPVTDAAGIPTVFLPLSTLFPNPASAFTGQRAWVSRYHRATAFHSLYNAAIDMGIDGNTALSSVLLMKDNGMPAQLDSLLDVLNDPDWAPIIHADAQARAQRSGGGLVGPASDSETAFSPTGRLTVHGAHHDRQPYGGQAGFRPNAVEASAPGMHTHSRESIRIPGTGSQV